jgi:hypothetical protein
MRLGGEQNGPPQGSCLPGTPGDLAQETSRLQVVARPGGPGCLRDAVSVERKRGEPWYIRAAERKPEQPDRERSVLGQQDRDGKPHGLREGIVSLPALVDTQQVIDGRLEPCVRLRALRGLDFGEHPHCGSRVRRLQDHVRCIAENPADHPLPQPVRGDRLQHGERNTLPDVAGPSQREVVLPAPDAERERAVEPWNSALGTPVRVERVIGQRHVALAGPQDPVSEFLAEHAGDLAPSVHSPRDCRSHEALGVLLAAPIGRAFQVMVVESNLSEVPPDRVRHTATLPPRVILQEAVDLLAERTWTSATIRAGPVRGAPPMAQPMAEPIRDLFDLPEQIRKGDFVHKLSEGVEHARGDGVELRGDARGSRGRSRSALRAGGGIAAGRDAARRRTCTGASVAASRTSWRMVSLAARGERGRLADRGAARAAGALRTASAGRRSCCELRLPPRSARRGLAEADLRRRTCGHVRRVAPGRAGARCCSATPRSSTNAVDHAHRGGRGGGVLRAS